MNKSQSQPGKGIAIVTGGYRGIGAATCVELRRLGYTTVSIDLDADDDNEDHYGCDLSNLPDLIELIDRIERERGPVEVLVNNAAVFVGKTFLEITPEDFDLTVNVNLKAPFFASQHCVRRMLAMERRGQIVNIASAAGRMGSPYVEYGAVKAAVIGFTKGLARVVADKGIRVNAIAPGQIVTDLHRKLSPERQAENLKIIPMKRPGEPEEIASVVGFLVSEASSFMTGAILDVNGGKH
jgi:NAD(P)-dependent dehydrogenase (short-subunit alcohol dehydrogenase family)